MKYAVFRKSEENVLSYAGSSLSLGSGPNELAYIVNGHGLKVGDVIHIDGRWAQIDSVLPATEKIRPLDVTVVYLPEWEDSNIQFGDGVWGPPMMTRLLNEVSEGECPGRERKRKRS